MTDREQIAEAVSRLLSELLVHFDKKVPEQGPFPDLRARCEVEFGDPSTDAPGWLELDVMPMEVKLDPNYNRIRFISVRVMKSRKNGYASMTCLHCEKQELRQEIEAQIKDPEYLVQRVEELASGLPEETNPDVWK